MSEFIGSRISLISKSDIRYVGTLHEINSETSTVALEQVKTFGTEGRRGNPDEEVPGSDSVYEYIVFRGSDVKDLRIEEAPKENKPPPPPQVPNDPAILGSGSRPPGPNGPQQSRAGRGQPAFQQPPPFPHQQYNNNNNNNFPNQRFGGPGQQGFPGPGPQGFQGGYPGMPYGAPPPGYFPPPGQGFPQAPPFGHHQQQHMPYGGPPPPQDRFQSTFQQPSANAPSGPSAESKAAAQVAVEQSTKPNNQLYADQGASNKSGPPPPLDSKPDVSAALASPSTGPSTINKTPGKAGRVVPAMPLPKAQSQAPLGAAAGNSAQAPGAKTTQAAVNAAREYQNATQAATAAVAAAMAKLPSLGTTGSKPHPGGEGPSADNLASKVNEMRVDERIRPGGRGGFQTGQRERGGRRGGREQSKVEVPSTDFDFESSNAKFKKEDLVKKANSPASTPNEGAPTSSEAFEDVVIPAAPVYNKSSFFDDISSEAKERVEANDRQNAPRGREFRNEERKKNLETFGMGSVDNRYGGGFRGRGRGRGRSEFRGGRGGFRGARGGFQAPVNGNEMHDKLQRGPRNVA